MPGIDPNIAADKLYVDPIFQPIKQKKRLFNDEKHKATREEVRTLLKVNAIRKLKFPNWIANVVLVKKPNNKWRMCIDFTSLSKAYRMTSTRYHAWGDWWMAVQVMKSSILWMSHEDTIKSECSLKMRKKLLSSQSMTYILGNGW
ncbi:hypothetical protein LIER_12253 [Lithospermum erythrorhizon]|uniref:Uncharacterized protein n=1 Tax=Lithospermum erythrorhizon TaxID=34254 RepID=A0AAV3PR41_LITER